jgi:hypothetical protein
LVYGEEKEVFGRQDCPFFFPETSHQTVMGIKKSRVGEACTLTAWGGKKKKELNSNFLPNLPKKKTSLLHFL